jgi:hypothetical protein
MKTTLAVFTAALVGFAGTVGATAQDKDKAKAGPKIEGTYHYSAGSLAPDATTASQQSG